MANVQVHCDYCARSLYDLLVHQQSSTTLELVVLYTNYHDSFSRDAISPNQNTFCDWVCASKWCLGKIE